MSDNAPAAATPSHTRMSDNGPAAATPSNTSRHLRYFFPPPFFFFLFCDCDCGVGVDVDDTTAGAGAEDATLLLVACAAAVAASELLPLPPVANAPSPAIQAFNSLLKLSKRLRITVERERYLSVCVRGRVCKQR